MTTVYMDDVWMAWQKLVVSSKHSDLHDLVELALLILLWDAHAA